MHPCAPYRPKIYLLGTYCPVLVGELHLRLLHCASVGEDIGFFTGLICCIWLHSRGRLVMSSPDSSHTHFCPWASVRVTTDQTQIIVTSSSSLCICVLVRQSRTQNAVACFAGAVRVDLTPVLRENALGMQGQPTLLMSTIPEAPCHANLAAWLQGEVEDNKPRVHKVGISGQKMQLIAGGKRLELLQDP